MIIDFHTHCFPDALAPRAIASLSATFSTMSINHPQYDGTAAGLRDSMKRNGITRSVVCNIATNAHQTHKVNDFAISLAASDDLIPLGSLHPDCEDPEGEINRLQAAGIKGLKIHPDYIMTHFDSPSMYPIYGLCEARGMFLLSHTGYDPISPDLFHAVPDQILHVLSDFPRLKVVAAHMGGLQCEGDVADRLMGKENLWFDTSLISFDPDRRIPLLRRLVKEHGASRLLFATDSPWSHVDEELDCIRRCDLPDDILSRIFCENALSLLA